MKPDDEKRSFYRIRDVVGLTCSLLDSADAGVSQPSESPSGLLAEIDRKFNQATNTLWLENPVLAQALGLLNRKLSLIAAHTFHDEALEADSHEELLVSISGSGIGFDSFDSFAAGARVRLQISLKPSNIPLELTGVVIDCAHRDDSPDKSHWVRVTFEEGNEAAQEQLIQHIVQRQGAQIREHQTESDRKK